VVIYILIPALVLAAGALLWALSSNAKLVKAGEWGFAIGLLILTYTLATTVQTCSVGPAPAAPLPSPHR
jgi:hypothetical protein